MKNGLILAILFSVVSIVRAQKPGEKVSIETSAVPSAVISQFDNHFRDVSGVEWAHIIGKGKVPGRYVASFYRNELENKARFTEEGNAITSTTYYRPNQIPPHLMETAKASGMTTTFCVAIHSLTSENMIYKLRVRQGTKVEDIYMNYQGKQIDSKEVQEDLAETDAEF